MDLAARKHHALPADLFVGEVFGAGGGVAALDTVLVPLLVPLLGLAFALALALAPGVVAGVAAGFASPELPPDSFFAEFL